jgi:hypothetical protein
MEEKTIHVVLKYLSRSLLYGAGRITPALSPTFQLKCEKFFERRRNRYSRPRGASFMGYIHARGRSKWSVGDWNYPLFNIPIYPPPPTPLCVWITIAGVECVLCI